MLEQAVPRLRWLRTGQLSTETRCLFATSLFSSELAQLLLPLGSGDPFKILQCWILLRENSGSLGISFHRETAQNVGILKGDVFSVAWVN